MTNKNNILKKLTLKNESISNLNDGKMDHLRGGSPVTTSALTLCGGITGIYDCLPTY